jgi:hypothetical protein
MASNLYRISGALAAAGCLVFALATVASANTLAAEPAFGNPEPAEILPVPDDNAPSTIQITDGRNGARVPGGWQAA